MKKGVPTKQHALYLVLCSSPAQEPDRQGQDRGEALLHEHLLAIVDVDSALGTSYRLSLQIVPYTGGGSLLAGGSEDSSLVECNLSLGAPLAGTEVGQRPYAHEVLAGAGETSEGVVGFGGGVSGGGDGIALDRTLSASHGDALLAAVLIIVIDTELLRREDTVIHLEAGYIAYGRG